MSTNMEQKHYKLGDAIRQQYQVPPLKTDLADAVTKRILEKQAQPVISDDKWIVVLGIFVLLVSVIYGIPLLSTMQLSTLLVIVVVAGMMGFVARKEYAAFKNIAGRQLS